LAQVCFDIFCFHTSVTEEISPHFIHTQMNKVNAIFFLFATTMGTEVHQGEAPLPHNEVAQVESMLELMLDQMLDTKSKEEMLKLLMADQRIQGDLLWMTGLLTRFSEDFKGPIENFLTKTASLEKLSDERLSILEDELKLLTRDQMQKAVEYVKEVMNHTGYDASELIVMLRFKNDKCSKSEEKFLKNLADGATSSHEVGDDLIECFMARIKSISQKKIVSMIRLFTQTHPQRLEGSRNTDQLI